MDKASLITDNKNSLSNLAVDGLLYGLVGGVAMLLGLAAFALFSGDSPGALLERFGPNGSTSPIQGLLSHLAVSAIYGVLFGSLIWPVLRRYPSANLAGWFGGLGYGLLLFVFAQVAILPGSNSPLAQLPFWEWASGHAIYGLVLGGLFARKVA
jgi:hypothetical protein